MRLVPALARRFSPLLGRDLDDVRVHADSTRAKALGARAFTAKNHIAFAPSEYAPATPGGLELLAHELAHVAQQSPDAGTHDDGQLAAVLHGGGPAAAHRSRAGADPFELNANESAKRLLRGQHASVLRGSTAPAIQCDVAATSIPSYPYGASFYTVGMAAGPNVLVSIDMHPGGEVTFSWVNFRTNEGYSGKPRDWDFLVGAARLSMTDAGFDNVGSSLGPTGLRGIAKEPSRAVLAAHEAGKVALPAQAVVSAYRGLIASEALKSLSENEHAVDALLDQPDRVNKFEQLARDLKEASIVRDALEARRDDLKTQRPGQHSFSFGPPKAVGALTDPYRLMQIAAQLREVEQTLAFWYDAFPLLTRIHTGELRGTRVEAELQQIKSNIIATRVEVLRARTGGGSLELMDLDNVRATLSGSLGPKTQATIKSEDTSRNRASIIKGGLLLAGSIALLFVPGGIFIDAAIGAAIAVKSWRDAALIGRAANTAIHADEGLMSQARARAANFEAILGTVFAVLGGAAAGLRILKVGRTYAAVARAAPELDLAAQIRLTRVLLDHPGAFRSALSLREAEALMDQLGIRLTFAELQALRVVILRRLLQTLPPQSAESLEEFLDVIWARRTSLRSANDVYKVYSGAREANALRRAATDYISKLRSLGTGRRGVSDLQNPANPLGTFWRFEREGADLARTTERIYLNVAADHAPEVMEMVVKDVVDNAAMRGVTMAKISGPNAIAGRADGIVIYLEDQMAARAVLGRVRAYQAANPTHFNRTTPYMTNQVLEGVSVGSEPLRSGGLVSFGSQRADAIWQALERVASNRNATREEFGRLVAERLRAANIDPTAPHLNLPPHP